MAEGGIDRRLAELEGQLRGLSADRETAYVLSPTGRILVRRSQVIREGEPHILNTFTRDELRQVTGNIVTHNHSVYGDSFSIADIRFLLRHHPRQLRAAGQKWRYIIEVKKGASLSSQQVDQEEVKRLRFGLLRDYLEGKYQGRNITAHGCTGFGKLWLTNILSSIIGFLGLHERRNRS